MAWVGPSAPRRHRLDEANSTHGIIQNDDFVSERLFEKLEVLRKAIGKRVTKQGTLRAVFDSFDLDGNGSIDEYELLHAFKDIGMLTINKEETKFFMEVMDQNGDNVVDFDEFVLFFENDVDQLKHDQDKRAGFRMDTLLGHSKPTAVGSSLGMQHEAAPMQSSYMRYSSGKQMASGRRTSYAFGFSTRQNVIEAETRRRIQANRIKFRKVVRERIQNSGGLPAFFRKLDPGGKHTSIGPEGPEIPIPTFKRGLDRLGLSVLYQSAKNVLEE